MFIKASSYKFFFAGQLLSTLINLFSQIILARILLPEGRGLYAIGILIATLSVVLTFFGSEYFLRYSLLSKDFSLNKSVSYLIYCSIISLCFSFIVITVLVAFKIINIPFIFLILSIILGFTQLIFSQLNVFLTISMEFKNASKYSIFLELLKFISLCLMLLIIPFPVTAIFSNLVCTIVIILYILNKEEIKIINLNYLKTYEFLKIYKEGIKSFFVPFANFANIQLGTFVIALFLTNTELGLYSLAFGLISKAQIIPDTINRFLVPIKNLNKDFNYCALIFKYMLFMSVILSVLIFFFVDFLVENIFGTEYLNSAILMKILFVGFSFKILSKSFEANLNEVHGSTQIVSLANIINLTLSLILMIFLIPKYGIAGAAYANSFGMLMSFLFVFIGYLKFNNISLLDFLNDTTKKLEL